MAQPFSIGLDTGHTRDDFIEMLVDLGYERSSMVIEQGTYSIKGSVVDVFPSNQNQPLRFDFFSGQLDRLTSFRPDTQRSIREIDTTQISAYDSTLVNRLDFQTRVLNSEVMANMSLNDYVVHERYGVGLFKGFTRLTVGTNEGEYVEIHYKGADKLYMPLDQIPLLHRYSGSETTPSLNGLYDGKWEKTRRNAHRALAEMAKNIYEMFKARQKVTGFGFEPDGDTQLAIEQTFPFDETPDQLKAIQDVKRDMEASRPMDRLVCGDVGFGKTEVMIRAAAKAALNLKQVMILVPTTILCEQHINTFKSRFSSFDIRVEGMSRLKTAKHNRSVIDGLKNHHIDIVIGTHRLLSDDVMFKDLGLVIVDEEQRFGVQHKEKIKAIATNIDILTTSATPIPRTLYMSLTGAKAMSVLATPPGACADSYHYWGIFASDDSIVYYKRIGSRGASVCVA